MFGIFNNYCIQLPAWVRAGETQNNKKLNQVRNDQIFMATFSQLTEIALKRYKIENLPENCNEKVVMMSLLWYGNCVFWDNGGSILALPGAPGSNITLYGQPSESYIYGATGFNKKVKLFIENGENNGTVRKTVAGLTVGPSYNAVMVKETMTMYPFINNVFIYADQMANTFRTLDVCVQNLKQPFLIAADEQLKPSIEKMFKDRANNEAFIVGTGKLANPKDKIQLFPFEANPQALRDCTMTYEWYLNRFLTLCGVQAANTTDKKAQVSVDELHSNEGEQTANGDSALDYLNSQLEIANKAFGLNMRAVSTQEKLDVNVNDSEDNDFEEGANNEGSND